MAEPQSSAGFTAAGIAAVGLVLVARVRMVSRGRAHEPANRHPGDLGRT